MYFLSTVDYQPNGAVDMHTSCVYYRLFYYGCTTVSRSNIVNILKFVYGTEVSPAIISLIVVELGKRLYTGKGTKP